MPAEKLARDDRLLALAQSALGAPAAGFEGVEAYPKFAQKATVLAWHLIRNHALPDGNKRMGYLALLEFVARNGRSWRVHPAEEEGRDGRSLRRHRSRNVSRDELQAWLERHLA